MSIKKYKNLGPIYLTQAKFDNLQSTGKLEIGREYKIIDYTPVGKKHLVYNNGQITIDSIVQTYDDIKNLLTDDNYIIYLTKDNYIYYPEYFDSTENVIWFVSTSTYDSKPYMYRISIDSTNSVKYEAYELALDSQTLPECPADSDGVLTFEATVSEGNVTYGWDSGIFLEVADTYAIDVTLKNIEADVNNPEAVSKDGTAILTFYCKESGYGMPLIAPVIYGATAVYDRISDEEGTITLSDFTDNVEFTFEAQPKLADITNLVSSTEAVIFTQVANATKYKVYLNDVEIGETTGEVVTYPITATIVGLKASDSNPTIIEDEGTATLIYTADGEIFKTPESVNVEGADFTYNRESDTVCSVTLSNPTDDIYVDVSAEVLPSQLSFLAKEDTDIAFNINGTLDTTPTLQYAINSLTDWNDYTFDDTISLTAGDICFWRGDNSTFSKDYDNYINFTSTGKVVASGEITSLYDSTCTSRTIPADYMFNDLFYRCRNLLSAPKLPATTLTAYCYYEMFCVCSSLIIAPELPATALSNSCYSCMFDSCTSLVNAPELPATTLADYCYFRLFCSCTSLATPPELPATVLASSCYSTMFLWCNSLTKAPELPATTLAYGCYSSMFMSCPSLTTAPELPATTLSNYCYAYMFESCTALTATPELPATTLAEDCYYRMFSFCSSLTIAPELPATTLANGCYYSMFYMTSVIPDCLHIDFTSSTVVNSGGLKGLFMGTPVTDSYIESILPKDSTGHCCLPVTTLTQYGCYMSMFEHCTSLTTAPALPATTLSNSCYREMFEYCTSLVNVPVLNVTSLKESCYYDMFEGCTSLTTVTSLPATALAAMCYYQMFFGCTSLITLPKLPATTLVNACYKYMFQNCTLIKLSTTQTGEYQNAYRIPTSGTGAAQSTSLDNMFDSTGGTFTGTPTINTTYYTPNNIID